MASEREQVIQEIGYQLTNRNHEDVERNKCSSDGSWCGFCNEDWRSYRGQSDPQSCDKSTYTDARVLWASIYDESDYRQRPFAIYYC